MKGKDIEANKTKYITYSILLISVICILVGVMRGEMEIVLQKAIRICLECIGIG